ncbi:Na/K ATPase alpha 1 subunit, putative [Talaromyces stipitatus ATCC 10500]|uniref:Na/K ATPase alpha 1 subunit, putative n=1 Tax=Talaromyces stipitatus (strain ATCC 10500 / CBS 375.48 / QM 6759 / NRRL 1006) TaxID=441959 RepID=B8MHR4_TALSN|nr:Na/K ATPase alpha 1 subunit, putative [Talaromyces stipitatus ATCC 10500]EED16394.1 Na/K ATPase alpha 1 subunit, putative [Talaromyces stipitatus ATCC 10500]
MDNKPSDPEKIPNPNSEQDQDDTDLEAQNRTGRITFLPDERDPVTRRPQTRGRSSRSRRRSQSRNSISRTRSHSVSEVPIEFRRLSYQLSESQRVRLEDDHEKPRVQTANSSKDTKIDSAGSFENLEFHSLPPEILCKQLGVSDADGLSPSEASERLARDGPNALPHRRENYLLKLLTYIFGGFCSVLWIGVIIFFICWRPLGDPDPQPYNLGLGILVLIVIFLQAAFSAFQDWSTARTMKAILDLLPAEALAIRSGQSVRVPSSDLVVGDIIKISIGNKVPADMRLLTTSGDVRFDRSMLTGESEEVEGVTNMTDENFLETRNIAMMGTLVTNGSATGVVVLTGKDSVMGHIALTTTSVKSQPTLIQREISRFVKIIVCLTVFLAALLLFTWAGWLRKDHPAFMNVVAMLDDVMGCVVAFIPEGMPVGVALTLMMIARRMKDNNILPKGLSTVETLGCVNVICSDKTGTLTENRMTVVTAAFVDERMSAADAAAAYKETNAAPIRELLKAAAICNDGTFEASTMSMPAMERLVQGNATDGASLKFVESVEDGSCQRLRDVNPRVFAIPFNSSNKWMLTLHKPETVKTETEQENQIEQIDRPSFLLIVKGASDILLPHCTQYWSYKQNSIQKLDENAEAQLATLQEQMSRNAERVIMLCQRTITPVETQGSNAFSDEIREEGLSDLTLIGLLGIVDPPRKETASTVASCRRAGIRFLMVTGDLGLTGAAIARDVGIFSGTADPDTIDTIISRRESSSSSDVNSDWSQTSLLLEGPSLSQLTDADWDVICGYQEIVFGRTMPEQKLRIVNEFRTRNYVVAVTGDGVNDAPAMRAADVGIAVVSGSDVALEAADLVLMDKFDSIVEAIRLGRLVFQNLQKVISYLLPAGSWSEIWPVLMNVYFGVPLPLSSFLMIIICVFTDLFLSLSLIMEQEEFDLLDLPPRNHRKDHLINIKVYIQSYLFIGVMETICAHAMFFLYFQKHAGIPFHALIFAFEGYSDGFYGYTADELTYFNTVGQSVYFITLLFLQWGNILSVRNKRLSILQADPIVRKERRNPWLLASAVISLAIAVFVTEEPGLQRIFQTASAPIEFWLYPIPLAVGILLMDEIRKLVVRMWPRGWIARIAW